MLSTRRSSRHFRRRRQRRRGRFRRNRAKERDETHILGRVRNRDPAPGAPGPQAPQPRGVVHVLTREGDHHRVRRAACRDIPADPPLQRVPRAGFEVECEGTQGVSEDDELVAQLTPNDQNILKAATPSRASGRRRARDSVDSSGLHHTHPRPPGLLPGLACPQPRAPRERALTTAARASGDTRARHESRYTCAGAPPKCAKPSHLGGRASRSVRVSRTNKQKRVTLAVSTVRRFCSRQIQILPGLEVFPFLQVISRSSKLHQEGEPTNSVGFNIIKRACGDRARA